MYEDIWNWRALLKTANMIDLFQIFSSLRFWTSWQAELGRYFKNTKLQQVLSFPAVFLGGSPFNTPALFSILAWADFGQGVWYPKGGMGDVVKAIVSLAKDSGVDICTQHEAVGIHIQDGQVQGVQTKTTFFPADVVVGAADLPWIETRLLPRQYQTWPQKYWQKKTIGISALLLYLGVNTRVKDAVHHTLFFSSDWEKNFEEIFQHKKLPRDPSLYISIRSATDRSIVPKNGEEIVVLVPLGAGGDYSPSEIAQFTEKIIDKVEEIVGAKLRDNLVVKEVFTPSNFVEAYHAFQGSALGLAHTLTQSLWFRPGNKSKKVSGLYYVGQYTNPGVGVPMALISAEIVAGMIQKSDHENENIFKRGSTTYYYSSLFFRGQVKIDVFSLYAYVRVIDDIVDSTQPNIDQLELMWQETVTAWNGGRCASMVVRKFVELAQRKGFAWEWVDAFWQAMRSDLHKKQYAHYQELEKYMYGSAEVIGYMMAKILDLPENAMKTAALQGRAMQLLNFIRDVKEDKELGRNYLGYTPEEVDDPKKWSRLIHHYLEQYRNLQEEAERGYTFIPKKYLVPIKTAADMYSWTAEKIRRNPGIVWQKKMKPHRRQVLMQLIINVLQLP
jgi:phytoene desaturase